VKLTPREMQVLTGLCAGKMTKHIAEDLGLHVNTVKSFRSLLMRKTKARNAVQLGIWAVNNGMAK
jgi:DNA-binding NarL/FixJ family response regulator